MCGVAPGLQRQQQRQHAMGFCTLIPHSASADLCSSLQVGGAAERSGL